MSEWSEKQWRRRNTWWRRRARGIGKLLTRRGRQIRRIERRLARRGGQA